MFRSRAGCSGHLPELGPGVWVDGMDGMDWMDGAISCRKPFCILTSSFCLPVDQSSFHAGKTATDGFSLPAA